MLPSLILASAIVKNQSCETAESCRCTDFSEVVGEEDVAKVLISFPFAPISNEQIVSLNKAEDSILACLQDVQIGPDQISEGLSVTINTLVGALVVDKSLLPFITRHKPGTDLTAFLEELSATFEQHDLGSRELFKKAAELKLGYYTGEQEADEFALEWVSDIGIHPQKAVEMELGLVELMKDSDPTPAHPFAVPLSSCAALAARDWKDESGQAVYVPVADYVDPHHSPCFRAYNLSREIEAHKISPKSAYLGLPNQGTAHSWEDHKKEIQKVFKLKKEKPSVQDLAVSKSVFAQSEKNESLKAWGTDNFTKHCRFAPNISKF